MEQGKKILLIDDSPSFVKVVEHHLLEAGYEVIVSANGLEGVEKAKKEQPNLILLDILMPIYDGYQTLEQLKAEPETQAIPVIIFTDKSSGHELIAGADDCVIKTFNPAILLGKVKKALSSQKV